MLYLNRPVWRGGAFYFEAAQMHHTPRQVDNAHRFAHVQHKHIAAFTHRASLQHQLRCFGNRHEVACDIGMGQRNRAAAHDLFFKEGDDRP